MRVHVLIAALVVGGCVGNGQPRDMGPGSASDPGAEIVDPPPKRRRGPKYRPQPDDPPPDDCVAHQIACFESRLSRERGGKHGHNRCQDCFEICQGQGAWPLYTWYQGRCDWWSYVKGSIAGLP